jgi:hypothetical protein
LSKKELPKKKNIPEVRSSEKKEKKPSTPTDRDHYVFESIIAEIGY